MSQDNEQAKWAIVTGASSGIGKETAIQLAARGYSLILISRRNDHLLELKESILKLSGSLPIEILNYDITEKDILSDWLKTNPLITKDLKILVNNAGLAKGVEKFQNSQIADIETMLDTNVKALMKITRAVLPYFVNNNQGHIINLGSVAGKYVYPGGAVYCASKFAVRAFTEGLRQDLLGTQVRVTNIEPGMVNTEFSLVRLGDQQKADQVYQGMTPLLAADIAETILWCLDRPAHVNIQELVIYPTDQAHVGMVHRQNI